jgi:hypothetical protein
MCAAHAQLACPSAFTTGCLSDDEIQIVHAERARLGGREARVDEQLHDVLELDVAVAMKMS